MQGGAKDKAGSKKRIGFISENCPPQMVRKDGISLTDTVGIMVKSIQELAQHNEDLANRIKALEGARGVKERGIIDD